MHHKQCDIEFKFHEDKQIYLRNKYCFAAIWFPEKVAEFKSFLSICVTLQGFSLNLATASWLTYLNVWSLL